MNRKRNCWDSAAAESFLCSLRNERAKELACESREPAISDVAESLETFYNRTRHHSYLGGLKPRQFE